MSSSGPQVMDIIKGALQGRSGSVASNFGDQMRNIQGGSQQINNAAAPGTLVGTQAPPPLSMSDMAAQNNFGAPQVPPQQVTPNMPFGGPRAALQDMFKRRGGLL